MKIKVDIETNTEAINSMHIDKKINSKTHKNLIENT